MRNVNWYCGGYFVLQIAFNNKKLREPIAELYALQLFHRILALEMGENHKVDGREE